MSPETQNPTRLKLPVWLVIGCIVGIVLGAIGIALAFAQSARQGWLWLIVNFVLFWGLASGMLSWAAAFRTAQATWTSAVNRLAQSAFAFTPVLAGILVALLAGVAGYAPWIHDAMGKGAWLNVRAFVIREVIAALLFWIPCWMMVRLSLRMDAIDVESGDRNSKRLNKIAVIATAAYAVTATIIAWDFVMGLSPIWISTMFSVYYFSTSMYLAMAVIAIMAAILRKPLGVEDRFKPGQFHDMGNLLLAFALFNMGLFYAQYVTIWYENLPEEVKFLILRYDKGAWQGPSWAAFLIGYAIPFLLLQSRMIKLNPKLLSAVAALIVLGVSLERYILVVPSLEPARLMIAPAGILSVLGCAAVFVLSVSAFLARYSPVSKADEVLKK